MYTLICNLFCSFGIKSCLYSCGLQMDGAHPWTFIYIVSIWGFYKESCSKRVWDCSPRNASQRNFLGLAFLVCKMRGSEQSTVTALPFKRFVSLGAIMRRLCLHIQTLFPIYPQLKLSLCFQGLPESEVIYSYFLFLSKTSSYSESYIFVHSFLLLRNSCLPPLNT